MTISSVNGAVHILGKREVVLESGGAFVRLADGNVTIGGPGDLILKIITIQKQGPATLKEVTTPLPKPLGLFDEQFTLHDEHTGELLPHHPYRIETASGEIVEGLTDALGNTVRMYADKSQALKIFKG
jgi:type VI secretion system secreted protein VgrG